MDAKEYFEQGYEKQLLKQFAEAIECYNKVLELDKDFERAYVQRAYCNVQLNEYKTAISDYKTALELNPNDPITYLNLGQTYYYLGQKGDTTYFDKAIELDENMFEAHFARGNALIYQEEYEQAIISLTRAIELESTWSAFYLCRAIAYQNMGNYQKALEDCYKAKQLNPTDNEIYKIIEECKNELATLLTHN